MFRRGGWLKACPLLVLPPKHRPFTVGFSLCKPQPSLRAIRSGTTPSVQSWAAGASRWSTRRRMGQAGIARYQDRQPNQPTARPTLRARVRANAKHRLARCPRVYDVGMTDQLVWFVMDRVPGKPIHRLMQDTPDLNERIGIALEAGARMRCARGDPPLGLHPSGRKAVQCLGLRRHGDTPPTSAWFACRGVETPSLARDDSWVRSRSCLPSKPPVYRSRRL